MQCLFALSEAQRSRRCGEKHMSETVTGYIDHVIFRNEDNGYTVMANSFRSVLLQRRCRRIHME